MSTSTATPSASSRVKGMPEIALYSKRLNRTLVLRRYLGHVHVHLYAGRKQPGQEPLVSGLNPMHPPMVVGVAVPVLERHWLEVGFDAYALDNEAEALSIAHWLGQDIEAAV